VRFVNAGTREVGCGMLRGFLARLEGDRGRKRRTGKHDDWNEGWNGRTAVAIRHLLIASPNLSKSLFFSPTNVRAADPPGPKHSKTQSTASSPPLCVHPAQHRHRGSLPIPTKPNIRHRRVNRRCKRSGLRR
jgi:hypothetical protein